MSMPPVCPLGRSARARGQSLVEFALVLPTFIFVVFALVQMILLLRAEGAVRDLARQVCRHVALAGAETSGIDASLQGWTSAESLAPAHLTVQVTTTGADDSIQRGDEHDAATMPAHPAPASAFGSDVTVSLVYTYRMDLPLVGQRTFTLPAQVTEATMAFGGAAQGGGQ